MLVEAVNVGYAGEIENVSNVQEAIDFIYDFAAGADVIEDMISAALNNIGVAEQGAY